MENKVLLALDFNIPLHHRLKVQARLHDNTIHDELIFLLEGVLPPVEELEAELAKKFAKGCTSTHQEGVADKA